MFNPPQVRLMRAVCGLDVHKDSVYLCILNEDGELIEKVFGVLTFQLQQMRDLLLTHHVDEVFMESTSVYWIPIWRILAPHLAYPCPPFPPAARQPIFHQAAARAQKRCR